MAIPIQRGNKFYAQIRRKEIELYATFSNLQDAELWIKYKEDLIDLISAFNPPIDEMITLFDAIELTIIDAQERKIKEIQDFRFLHKCFEPFCQLPLNEITHEMLLDFFNESMNTPIQKGRNTDDKNTGVMKLPSIHTIFRRYGYLSCVYELMIRKKWLVHNHALTVCKIMRPFLKKNKK
jgi:hypothetical protein